MVHHHSQQHHICSNGVAILLLLCFFLCAFSFVQAVPGPDTTAVLANVNVPESVTLAYYYAQQRSIPRKQVCLLNITAGDGVTTGAAISLALYKKDVLYPTRDCLQAAGVEDRIEAFMLVRGIPIRVTYSSGSCSLAATLQVWFSPASTGSNTLWIDSNTPSVDAHFNSIYTAGPFHPNYTATYFTNTDFQFRLATMLNGRSYEDATSLVDTAIKAEAYGWSPATMGGSQFLLMKGPTNDPRQYLDGEFPGVCTKLIARGYNCTIVSFNANLVYKHPLASFMVGTASMGSTIEGNNYTSCAIVDNLTSYGAVAVNFQATGQSQVSISRWVERGVLAVHGTVEEPYADAFPSRYLLVDYVDGYTVGESYLMEMPEFFWMNLVIGDVMAAPFAERPVITFAGGYDSDTKTFCGSSSCSVKVSAAAPSNTAEPPNNGKGNIGWIGLYVNGDLVDEVYSSDRVNGTATLTLDTRTLDPTVYPSSSFNDLEVLIVAQYAQAPKSKGWMLINNATFVSEFPSSSAARTIHPDCYSYSYGEGMIGYLLSWLL